MLTAIETPFRFNRFARRPIAGQSGAPQAVHMRLVVRFHRYGLCHVDQLGLVLVRVAASTGGNPGRAGVEHHRLPPNHRRALAHAITSAPLADSRQLTADSPDPLADACNLPGFRDLSPAISHISLSPRKDRS